MRKIAPLLQSLLTVAVVVMLCGIASAQVTDIYWTNYFSNNTASGAADATLHITNPGLQGGSRGSFTRPGPGSLCAMIYVHRSNQTINECCGCLVTPNGLQTISVHNQLTANTLTGVVPNNGEIQVISAAINSGASATSSLGMFGAPDPAALDNSIFCDPSASYTLTPDLRVWMTHLQAVDATNSITETGSLPAPLGASELGWEQGICNFAVTQGSGQGVCDCGVFEK